MGRQYSAKTFLRNTPNALLKQYFDRRGIDLGLDWSYLSETEVEPLFVAFEKLDDGTHSEIDADFRMVYDLACEDGVLQIVEQATLWDADVSGEFHDMRNAYERAFWTFLNQPMLFRTAGRFHEMDRYGGWHRRFVGYRLEARTDEDALRAFTSKLRLFYRKQGRGKHCHIDYYLRSHPQRHCFFAFPEDYANAELGYDSAGRFQQRARRSAFEIIFVYRPEEGMIEVHARGGNRDLIQLETIFCTNILGLIELPDDTGKVPYDLGVLNQPEFGFPLDPALGVESVELRALRYDLPQDSKTGAGRRLMLTVASRRNAGDALQRMRSDALSANLRPGDLFPSQARLRMTFRPQNGHRPKAMTFEVTYPDRCTLKDDPHDQIARKCLRAWGIARD
ncbi:MAG: hypothetical protein LC135_05555 [Phycisphaerae bacterium]|jgi:hypothetical protein|nr:hypothetical protein [Phycisphaerae bacterium]MCZ2399321.1 hypothetical protein [Phycisphaerae bacterium]